MTATREAALDQKSGVWKSGKGKGRATPKGRQLDDQAHAEVRALLQDRPRRHDLLIEFLHLIQDAYGHLSAAHLRALAEEMRLSMAEVQEVASFYAHFDIVREGETPPPDLTIRVCDSLSCELAGAEQLLKALEAGCDARKIRVLRAPCMGRCDLAPVAEVGHYHQCLATPENVMAAVEAGKTHAEIPQYQDFAGYSAAGGYSALEALRTSGEREKAIETVLSSGLRGLGGAGFPTGRKLQYVLAEEGPRYLAVNADEGEPGTFKDRFFLEEKPHLFLEGALIAAWAIEAEKLFIYLRDEYPAARLLLLEEISKLEDSGLIQKGYIDLRRGAGAYICGEESAMIESIEGKRGLPRHRPPFVAQVGIFGRPTLVQNVETLCWVTRILRDGPEVWQGVEKNGRKGPRSYSVSGRVANPGMYELPAGSTILDVIEAAGGMADGHSFHAYQPGGPSSGLLPATLDDVPLDFDTLHEHGTFIGSAAVVVLSDKDRPRDAALNMLRFFEDESCGQCTPCRVGCEKAVKLMQAEDWNKPLLEELCEAMADASICGLGQAAPNPIRLVMKHFPEEI
ncbi:MULTISPECIES: NAD(P)H-dependent oxidoreductase subunit E [Halocynthiibacter]|uniref:NAD(P)H-dependent oxidoreductase subunit E n=1 Tax=Halocynthiibacter halioticoli TaxID=2986804 RepID=A0AAE3IXK3_9RHOB|nr:MULTISPECIES: NAD(P)H-dependent oxidoreductase subunit E [Halocynthiibacter]MCV6823854.1 NAD(P)H-dependent oxidoreductase subunit E [Halocynthiibacter halioticoli]MCW4056855.1 NAD(P)H-dependent oxidoreductase subunit E [Halocynthiibacter sp. SDUM655004]